MIDRSCPPDTIRIQKARTHNLQGVDLDLPRNQLTVITGVSGSGKSSLAIDTLYAEGQRQYIESLSTYARQFLHQMQRPDVESIQGLQPTLCIDQQAGAKNPRSTVATVTEVYDYLRLLMARVGTPTCFACGHRIDQQTADQIVAEIQTLPEGTKLVLMAPVVRGRRGAHRDELNEIRAAGLVRVRVDGQLYEVDEVPNLAPRKNHTIEAVVDKVVIRPSSEDRLRESVDVALRLASGLASVSYLTPQAAEADRGNEWDERLFSTLYACANCGVNYEELEPRTFSFNSPYGACSECSGFGNQLQFELDSIVANWNKSARHGGFAILTGVSAGLKRKLKTIIQRALERHGVDWDQPLDALKPAERRRFWQGTKTQPGLQSELHSWYDQLAEADQVQLDEFLRDLPCGECGGARLRPEALSVHLREKNIHDLCEMGITQVLEWFSKLQFDPRHEPVGRPIVTEMLHRLRFLEQVGVGYLTLGRSAHSLSGGELQRVRLATSVGSGLVGVCYVLDEPSIGLHQRDNDRLIESLRDLQRQGNTVIVVEHDEAMMRAADRLVDVGPGAGSRGGHIVCAGPPSEVENDAHSLTAKFLRGEQHVHRDSPPRSPEDGRWLELTGATLHNLKRTNVQIPLGMLVGVTGVSGSGKSSLFAETVIPALMTEIGQARPPVGPYKKLAGFEHVDKLIEITQTPIGRSPRSTPATFCGVFDLIRAVWANTREAKQRGFTASRFSFNAGSGRCTQCQGQGQEKIEMNFLPDLYVVCSVCGGKRFNRQTLQVRYRDRSIADVLEMSVDDATEFFENFSKIHRLLHSLQQVGLGYLSLGQSSSTLSGGEAQRIKLATELAKSQTGKTFYFLDEPTTGLHFADVKRLILVLDGLVAQGNTVVVVEHNLDVIKACDWLIDMGPEGGQAGGEIVATGPPAEVAKCKRSVTGQYL